MKLFFFFAFLIFNFSNALHSRTNLDFVALDDDNQVEKSEDLVAETKELNGTTCKTLRGNPGKCAILSKCYPLIFQDEDLFQSEYKRRSEELAKIIADDVGFCKTDSLKFSGIDSFYKETGISIDLIESLICCPEQEEIDEGSSEIIPTNEPKFEDEAVTEGFAYAVSKSECGIRTEVFEEDVKEDESINNCTHGKVINGKPATVGQIPFQVGLLNNGRLFCGGSIIDSTHILTAAHCIKSLRSFSSIEVLLGAVRLTDSSATKRKIAKGFYHRNFDMRRLQNDVAVLKLREPVTFSSRIKAICLATSDPPLQQATVSGWGKTSEHGSTTNDLLHARVRVISQNDCKKAYGKYPGQGVPSIEPHMICASGPGDACNGDSGGPLFIDSNGKAVQVGIVSWGMGCGREPGVFCRPNHYLTWIKARLAD